jgi:type-F conjugative transfer system pilin chaperone TraQ
MRKFKLPAFDVTGMWLVGLGFWCNMVAGCVYSLPEFAWGLAKVLAVGLVLTGGYRILDAIATRVADERLAPEKDAYRAQHGVGEASGTSGKQDETPQEDKHVSMH